MGTYFTISSFFVQNHKEAWAIFIIGCFHLFYRIVIIKFPQLTRYAPFVVNFGILNLIHTIYLQKYPDVVALPEP